MIRFTNILFVFVTALSLASTQSKASSTDVKDQEKDQGKWQEKMQSLAQVMGELLPELVSPNGDPKIIEKDAKALSELSHSLKEGRMTGKMMPPSDLDPSIGLVAGRFSDETKHAYFAIQHGNLNYGKTLLRSTTAYCIACHTRHENGPEFPTFPLNPKVEGLGREEKAEIYVATRQFDKGLAEFQSLIADEELVKKHPFEWERPLRNALAIAVRVKNDPSLAMDSVNTALKSPFVPEFERASLLKWKDAIESWKKETKPKANTENQLVSEMKRLIANAKASQSFPIDHSGEIQYLRASGSAHDLLRVTKKPQVKAEALRTAGIAYEVLANPVFWPMHELYYKACVRELPHSKLAQDCYQHFEQSVYFGYTGSAGTFIPDDIQTELLELKSLASPKVKNQEKAKKDEVGLN